MTPLPGRSRAGATALALIAALALLVAWAASNGPAPLPAGLVGRILAGKLLACSSCLDGVGDVAQRLVLEIRLPRIVAAGAVGAALALSGGLFQGLLQNPLADSYTLGVSAGGALGACLGLLAGVGGHGELALAACSLAGSLAALAVVLTLATARGRLDPVTLVLAGVIVSATLQAGLGFVKFLAGDNVAGLVFWLMGGFVAKTWSEAWLALGGLGMGLAGAVAFARDLDALCAGDETAKGLGVNVAAVRLGLLVCASACVAACVAVSGIIGFVGLVVPHMVRLAAGPAHRRLLPLSALAGAVLLLAADTAVRTVLPHEVPVGVLTALLGGPYFCLLFVRGAARV
ncbi:iron ABC transporter permease [Fundidesulfovibrio butyratiphilus]